MNIWRCTNLDDETISFYIHAKVVSDKVKAALAEVIKRKAAQGQLVAKRAELEQQMQIIVDEQNRIRQNMAQLPKDTDLFRRYVTKFNEQEDKIDQLREQIKKAIADETAGQGCPQQVFGGAGADVGESSPQPEHDEQDA